MAINTERYVFMNLRSQPNGDLLLRLLAFFFLALLIRLVPLGYYVTPDEPIWVFRAVQFADAVAARDYAAIPQTGHPGVTTMLLGALGVRLTTWVRPIASQTHLTWIRNLAWLAPENAEAFPHLAAFLLAGRVLVALVTSTGVALIYALAWRRLGEMVGRLLALFLALDPFFAGHAGLLHTDALQATFVLLAVLFALPPQRGISAMSTTSGRYISLAGAALYLALAGLTKTLGLLVAPGLALAILLLERATLTQRFLRVVFLAMLSLAFLLAFYLPFWTNPRQALTALAGAVVYHEGIGLRDVFFAGRMTSDPGPWFYPAVLLFRLTPPVLLGVVIALLRTVVRRFLGLNIGCTPIKRKHCGEGTQFHSEKSAFWATHNLSDSAVVWFVLPMCTYLFSLSLANKKFDRYVLSGVSLLTAIAAFTWARFLECHPNRPNRPKRSLGRSRRLRPLVWRWGCKAMVASLLLPWALIAPLPLTYANPFLGGPWLAQHIVPLGWGEAFGLSATRLKRVLRAWPSGLEPASLMLLSPNVPGTAPFFPGETRNWDPALLPCADVLVLGGASKPPSEAFERVTQVRLARRTLGKGYVRAALVAETNPPTSSTKVTVCNRLDAIPRDRGPLARFSGELTLQAAAWPEAVRAPDALPVRFRWYPRVSQGSLNVQLRLEDERHLVWAEGGGQLVDSRTWLAPTWEVNQFAESTTYVGIPLSMPPGTYTLTLRVFDNAGRSLGYWKPQDIFGGTRLSLGTVVIKPAPYPAARLELAQSFDAIAFPGLTLIGASAPPTEHWAGDPLPFQLGWIRTVGDPMETLYWTLICDNGAQDGGELPLAPDDPVQWPIGYRYKTRYAPRTDPLLPEGDCTLFVRASSASASHSSDNGLVAPSNDDLVALGQIRVHARARTFTLSRDPQIPLTITVGDSAALAGAELVTTSVQSGESFTITLVWRAHRSLALDYTVFVHMISDSEGHLLAQSDQWPQGGNAPTSSWVPGQVIFDTHTLTLPPDAPPGQYTLVTGMYDAESGGRLPLYDQGKHMLEDRAPLCEISVTGDVGGGTSDGATR